MTYKDEPLFDAGPPELEQMDCVYVDVSVKIYNDARPSQVRWVLQHGNYGRTLSYGEQETFDATQEPDRWARIAYDKLQLGMRHLTPFPIVAQDSHGDAQHEAAGESAPGPGIGDDYG